MVQELLNLLIEKYHINKLKQIENKIARELNKEGILLPLKFLDIIDIGILQRFLKKIGSSKKAEIKEKLIFKIFKQALRYFNYNLQLKNRYKDVYDYLGNEFFKEIFSF